MVNKGGRPPAFNRAKVEKLADGIRMGMPIDASLQRADIASSTYYDWQAGRWPRSVTLKDRQWFSETLKSAAADGMYDLLVVIRNASIGALPRGSQWQAAAWILERRYPEHFGRRQLEVTGSGGGPIQHHHDLFTRILQEVSERMGVDPEEILEDAEIQYPRLVG
jgi:hypothetical protein